MNLREEKDSIKDLRHRGTFAAVYARTVRLLRFAKPGMVSGHRINSRDLLILPVEPATRQPVKSRGLISLAVEIIEKLQPGSLTSVSLAVGRRTGRARGWS